MTEKSEASTNGYSTHDESLSPLIKAYIDRQVRQAQENEGRSRKKKWRNSWRSASPITKGTFLLSASVAIATIAYSLVAAFQLKEMQHTNQLTESALRNATKSSQDSSHQFQVQLGHFDAGLGRSDVLASRTSEQASASRKFADAAKKQADLSKLSLQATINNFHQEQRAYLVPGDPTDEGGFGLLKFPIRNYGKPSLGRSH